MGSFSGGSTGVSINSSEPISPNAGEIWVNNSTNRMYYRNAANSGWIELTQAEYHTFTAAENFNPREQTGLGFIDIDTNNMTSGSLNVIIDGTTTNILVSGQTLNKFINPSSSLALTTAGANFSYNQFNGNVSGLYDYMAAGGYNQYNLKDVNSFWFNNDGTKFYFVGKLDSAQTWHVFQNSVSSENAWNFTTANDSYDGISSALPSPPFGYYGKVTGLKDNGTKMFVIDRVNNSSGTGNAIIYRFDWSTAYDATTCATSASNSMTVNDFSGQQIGMGWNNDGTKLFIYNQGNDTIYRYSLSTAWDLSTESLDSGQTKSGVGLSSFASNGIYFNANGTRLYARGFNGSYSYYKTWSLSTAWDLTTLSSSYTSDFNSQGNGGQYGTSVWTSSGYWITDGTYDFWRYQDQSGYIQKISETFGGTAFSSLT